MISITSIYRIVGRIKHKKSRKNLLKIIGRLTDKFIVYWDYKVLHYSNVYIYIYILEVFDC